MKCNILPFCIYEYAFKGDFHQQGEHIVDVSSFVIQGFFFLQEDSLGFIFKNVSEISAKITTNIHLHNLKFKKNYNLQEGCKTLTTLEGTNSLDAREVKGCGKPTDTTALTNNRRH